MLCQKGRFVADSGNPNENIPSTDAGVNGEATESGAVSAGSRYTDGGSKGLTAALSASRRQPVATGGSEGGAEAVRPLSAPVRAGAKAPRRPRNPRNSSPESPVGHK